MGIADSDLATIRLAMNDLMPDRGTNSRTNAITEIRCAAEKATERLHGLPSTLKVPRWQLKLPDGTDVEASDVLTVPTKGVFSVLWKDDPGSYTVQIVCHAVRILSESGRGTLYLPTPATFADPARPADTIATHVYLYDASEDLELFPAAVRYKLAALYDPALRAGSGAVISANWEITWTQPNGIAMTETISKPRYVYSPIPCAIAYFGSNN